MPKRPCRLCGTPLITSRLSLPEPTCQPCRRGQPRPAPVHRPTPAIRRGKCRRCGKQVYIGRGSLPNPMCQPCRRIEPQRVKQNPRRCACGRTIMKRDTDQCYICRNDKPSAHRRGYGQQHREARIAYLEAFTPGDECPRCGDPMLNPADLDLDHTDDRTGYLGLSHSWCNRGKGAVLPPYKPRTRPCEVCGTTFTGRRRTQRACGRACGVELRRRAA